MKARYNITPNMRRKFEEWKEWSKYVELLSDQERNEQGEILIKSISKMLNDHQIIQHQEGNHEKQQP